MTDEQQHLASDENVEKVQAGTLLKNKRESLGLSQKQIADRLRLRLSIIENIESNNFASDQVATFTRGYLRSYARAVGLAESEVLCAIDGCEETQPEEQEMKSFSRKTKREAHDSRIMTLTWGIIIVVLGISSVWWWQNQEKSMESLTSDAELEQQLEQQAENQPLDFTTLSETDVEPMAREDETQSLDSTTMPTTENVAVPDAVETEIVVEPQQAPESKPEPQPQSTSEDKAEQTPVVDEPKTEQSTAAANLLSMSFDDDCWIQVKDATGKTLSTGVKKAGQSLNLSGDLPYSVILGAPENVSMTLASEPVDLSGYTSGKVARFNLP
ncbi:MULTISPECIES: cytoskeleton protein RodZ [Vibrio]|uniref:Transcriptional regulator n=1 Tax=Vibrio bivalvicida TaxID=1276888 RepID=A0A177XWB1_9VIBR|nr:MULTISPECIES: cytoskeleton protein RodZ [Vibrio]KLN62812.1 transcriptional regulator [Vibrio sp. VPAP30]OAJ92555.1 transcriptional regulator [Vibrio bivalvicida]